MATVLLQVLLQNHAGDRPADCGVEPYILKSAVNQLFRCILLRLVKTLGTQ